MSTLPDAKKDPLAAAIEKLIELLGQDGGFLLHWKDGPYVPFRTANVSHDLYLDAIRALEAGPVGLEGLPALVQRMRRMAFSIFTYEHKGVGALLFDFMLNLRTNYAEPPLTVDHVGIAELNRLYGTGNLVTLVGSKVGISHAWGGIDVTMNGVNLAALAAQTAFTFSTPTSALATWLGDLGNSVRGYEMRLPRLGAPGAVTALQRRTLMVELLNENCPKGDLLGDLDGIAIGPHWARSPHAFTASTFLQEYYDNDTLALNLASQLGRPSAAYRFHYFLKYVEPRLPSGGLDSTPFVATFDKVAAKQIMPGLVANAVDDMLKVARLKATMGSGGPEFYFTNELNATPTVDRLAALGGVDAFQWLCDAFCTFIDDGVRTGDATWPPVP